MLPIFKKLFQVILIVIGLYFIYGLLDSLWFLIFENVSSHEELVRQCNKLFDEGLYSSFSESDKLNACLDDEYKYPPGASLIAIIFVPISGLLAWLCLRFGLRIFNKD